MIDTSKVLKAVNDKLKELYPTYKVYGVETKEGYKLPCFNTELIVKNCENLSSNLIVTPVEITIDFLMATVDTVLQMSVGDTLRKNFYKYLVVGDRVLHVAEYHQGYTGDYGDILSVEITINVYENLSDNTVTNPILGAELNLQRK